MIEAPTSRPWLPLAHPRRTAIVGGVLAISTVGAMLLQAWEPTAAWLRDLDLAWHDRMRAAECAGWITLAQVLYVVGGAWVTVPLGLAIAALLALRRSWARFALWVGAVVSAELISLVLKGLYGKPRPVDHVSDVFTSAFPSGHTTSAAAIGLALVLVFLPPGRTRGLGIAAALVWALLMAWSRTYLRDHWLSDVGAGFLLGTTCAVAAALVVARRWGGAQAPTIPRTSSSHIE